MKTSLRQARDEGKLIQFAAEREGDAPGDADAFNRAVTSMARTSKEAPTVSRKHNRDR